MQKPIMQKPIRMHLSTTPDLFGPRTIRNLEPCSRNALTCGECLDCKSRPSDKQRLRLSTCFRAPSSVLQLRAASKRRQLWPDVVQVGSKRSETLLVPEAEPHQFLTGSTQPRFMAYHKIL